MQINGKVRPLIRCPYCGVYSWRPTVAKSERRIEQQLINERKRARKMSAEPASIAFMATDLTPPHFVSVCETIQLALYITSLAVYGTLSWLIVFHTPKRLLDGAYK